MAHVTEDSEALRSCPCLSCPPGRHPRQGTTHTACAQGETPRRAPGTANAPVTPGTPRLRLCGGRRPQPVLQVGGLILQNDPIQETALQGQTDREHAQAERLAPGVGLLLVLLTPELAIERMQAARHPTARQKKRWAIFFAIYSSGQMPEGLSHSPRYRRILTDVLPHFGGWVADEQKTDKRVDANDVTDEPCNFNNFS
jgi:hypothetical protein